MEVAITTRHNGVLVVVLAALAASVIAFPGANKASASQAGTGKTVSTRTTKGVRNTTSKRTKAVVAPKKVRTVVALPPEAPADTTHVALAEKAKQLVGSRYVRGGSTPRSGFDCSGFVRYILGDKAASLPRTSGGLYQSLTKTNELHPGDVVFFGRTRVQHVGIYTGNGEIIHASTPRSGVRSDSLPVLARQLGFMGVAKVDI